MSAEVKRRRKSEAFVERTLEHGDDVASVDAELAFLLGFVRVQDLYARESLFRRLITLCSLPFLGLLLFRFFLCPLDGRRVWKRIIRTYC